MLNIFKSLPIFIRLVIVAALLLLAAFVWWLTMVPNIDTQEDIDAHAAAINTQYLASGVRTVTSAV